MKFSDPIVQAIAKNWPFNNGIGHFIDKYAVNDNLGNNIRECLTSDGFNLDVYESDHIGRHIILSGQFDRSPAQVLIDFARKGDIILDIGANIGYVSCLILHNVIDSKVICVEPQPDIATLLTANLARFPAARSSIVQVALSDVEGETLININRANRGASSIHYEFDGGAISVPTISANDLLGSMDQLDLIKIDVEGHEETILRNAQNQINRLKPRVIQFEDREGKAWAKGGIGSILYDLNYKVYAIKKSLFRTRLFLVNSISDCVDNDYVAISSWVNVAIPSKYK